MPVSSRRNTTPQRGLNKLPKVGDIVEILDREELESMLDKEGKFYYQTGNVWHVLHVYESMLKFCGMNFKVRSVNEDTDLVRLSIGETMNNSIQWHYSFLDEWYPF